jgi:hypothetical protein
VSFNKYKKTEITPPAVLLQWNKTRTQQQKKQQKTLIPLETRRHVAPCSVGHGRNKGVNQKVPGI